MGYNRTARPLSWRLHQARLGDAKEQDFVEGEGSLMKLSARIIAGIALLVVLGSTVGCTKLRARDQLVKGVQAFKAGHYEEAVGHFQNSIALDPNYESAKLYLATAYSYQVVPNLDTPDNLEIAQKAMDGFNEVLAKNPNDLDALRQIASIQRNIKHFDEAKATEQKIISLAPNDAEANYTIGVIDWTQAYKNAVQILGEQNLQDDGNGNVKMNKATCAKMKAANTQLIDEAMKYLNRAVEIQPELRRRHVVPEPQLSPQGRPRVPERCRPQGRPRASRSVGPEGHRRPQGQRSRQGKERRRRHHDAEPTVSISYWKIEGLPLGRPFSLPLTVAPRSPTAALPTQSH